MSSTSYYQFQINGIVNTRSDYKPHPDFRWDMELNQILMDIFFGNKKSVTPDWNAQIYHVNSGPKTTMKEAEKEAKTRKCKTCNSINLKIKSGDSEVPRTKESYVCLDCGHTGVISYYIKVYDMS